MGEGIPEMDTIVQQLIKGSDRINQMQEEIKRVISMLLSFIDPLTLRHVVVSQPGPHPLWLLESYKLSFHVIYTCQNADGGVWKYGYITGRGWESISIEYIQRMCNDLPVFMNMIRENFPESLKPISLLLQAAN